LQKPVHDDINRYIQLINIERNEEIRQYRQSISTLTIPERKKNGTTWYPVNIANEEIGLGGKLMIDLQRPVNAYENHLFQQGQTAAIFVNAKVQNEKNPVLNGTIVWVRDNTMRVALGVDTLPDWVDEGKLGIDLLYNETTFREMDFVLQRLLKAEDSRLGELRDVLFGYTEPQFNPIDTTINYANLNQVQNKAVQHIAAARDMAIIHGPPGTGKTTTLVQAILHTLKLDEQVLVTTASNTAVDLLTEKLCAAGVTVLRLGHPARINETLLEHTLDGQMAMHPDYKRLQNFRKEAHNYRREARKYKRTFGSEQREERKMMLEQAKLLMDHAKMTERYIVQHLVDKAQVICCTLVGASSMELKGKQFKTVFIDEASQAMLPATFIPIAKAQKVVFAGDHCQLPPTVKSMEAQQKGLAISLFEHCIQHHPQAAIMLQVQYRMNEKIMQFSSNEFYDSQLQAAPEVQHHLLGDARMQTILSTPLDFIDTAGCGFDEALNGNTQSLSNQQEAKLLLDYLTQIYERLEIECTHTVWELTVGIISPYKQQVVLIKEMLKNYALLMRYGTQISVNTVDGFQGQERDIVAISLVRSNDRNEIGFLKDLRRMNVALTRARKKLVVVGDSATLGAHHFYERWIQYTETAEAYHSAWEFLYD
jgi:ATP-dependent RNA/DNA helicase IGHMBP2